MSTKNEIIESIKRLSRRHSPYRVFYDWVKISSLAIANACELFHGEIWKKREDEYISICKQYTQEEIKKMQEMLYLLGEAYEEKIEDVLGEVYMKSGCYSKELGQFFTPYHLAELNSALCLAENINENEKWVINEPSCGGGANIISCAKVLKDKGINYQKVMEVYAQDLDWLGVYMSYLQFSLLGISARVAQGDTLHNPFTGNNYPLENVLITPKAKGILL